MSKTSNIGMYAMLCKKHFGKLYRFLGVVLSCTLVCSDLVDAQTNCSDSAQGPSAAQDTDDAERFFALGQQYSKKKGCSEQEFRAYLKAAEMGHAKAQLIVAEYYSLGFVVRLDRDRAQYWRQCAAEQGLPEAQVQVAEYYAARAHYWMNPSFIALHDAATAQEMAKQFAIKAFYWMKQAAEQGSPEAQFCLGKYYEEGFGVPQDKQLAQYWFRLAAEQSTSEIYTPQDESESGKSARMRP